MIISLTEQARKEIARIIEEGGDPQVYLRVGVRGGGCSGFQYRLAFDREANPKRDHIEELDGVRVAIDKRSALYLEGTTIDFSSSLNSRGFVFNNPKSRGVCGCGSSFSV